MQSHKSLYYIQQKRHLSRKFEVMKLVWHPDTLFHSANSSTPPQPNPYPLCSVHFKPPPTLSTPLHLFLHRPPSHPAHWLGTMASVSLLGTQIKGKLQPTSMQNVIWKACSYVLAIDFSLFSNLFPLTRCLSPRSSSPFLSKHNNMQCEI